MADVSLHDGLAPSAPSPRDADAPPAGADSAGHSATPAISDELKARMDKVVYSDIGITALLTRLKQSVASARDFSTFLKKRSSLEEEHAQGLRKLSRSLLDASVRTDNRQGTYSQSHNDLSRFHDRMADHGLQFAVSLQQMADNLHELASNIERGRKQWKQTGLSAEKRVMEAEAAAEKAKAKYESLAEQYDRVKTGDKQGGKFGLKGPKSAAQHEEELFRKVQNADSDYASKVQAAQAARQELVSTHRPQAVHNIQQLISECDSGLTLQMQKFATFNEKLLLGQGLSISPLKDSAGNAATAPKSLYEVIQQIDNDKDYRDYVLSHQNNPGAVTSEQIKYERHPTLGGTTGPVVPASQTSTQNKRNSSMLLQSFSQQHLPAQSSQQSPAPAPAPAAAPVPSTPQSSYPHNPDSYSSSAFQPPYPVSDGPSVPEKQPLNPPPMAAAPSPLPPAGGTGGNFQQHLPPLKPVFGVSLEDLYLRDGTAVPMIVYQCFQAIELFGLDMEGIYRLSGSANHINQMKQLFDNDSSQVDFTNPENFYHDVNSVAGLLKQFFRDLPDPLFTSQSYSDFINAARIDDDVQRRDSLHALVNNLPDAHYATLRALILHLNKVQEHYTQNRMNAGNIAICFGPTLMGASSGGNVADAGWQVRVIETVLLNTYQIFDDD
ncbi:Rho GTPase activator (Rgd1) [Aspergillus bombycis]|uniref:Rho GTPase activator (Rgd1) n=1 Tax=Aspergillus bombycis TaxID=109264 RepID=A0A1F8A2L0_9EURO|nr:Rho GTPase activator (Rgd1) [Aspergillus bombycis]OGM45952.1 Rho GTPase activator (Rgd1) [Aspergillus bombycis]